MDSLECNIQKEVVQAGVVESERKGLSGSTLKIIAIVTMMIDHVGAALLGRYIMASGYLEIALAGDVNGMIAWLQENSVLYWTFMATRMIGRIAFPIFCFLLIEGFQKTHDVKKYAMRLGLFALISEIPFDLAFNAKILEFTYQNVFFTLFLGLLAIICYDKICQRKWVNNRTGNTAVKLLLCAMALGVFCFLANLLHTDYSAIGVICITVLYAFRKKKPAMIAAGCVAFLWEITAPLAFIPIGFYNGKRGLKLKYVFYLFYPLHLLLIYLVSMCLGMAGYSVM